MKRAGLIAGAALAWAATAWVMLFAGLGAVGLIGPDEPRYAAIAAAMGRSRDFITPRLWGVPWLEKPILYYWLAALAGGLGRIGDAAARLPNAALAAALSLALGLFLWRVHSARAGVLAAWLTLTAAMTIVLGRAATTDMTLAAPFALGMMALYLFLREQRSRWLMGAAAALALATLAKGPVAVVLAGLALIGFAATQRRWRLAWRRLGDGQSASRRPLPGIAAHPPSDQRERPWQEVASHPALLRPWAVALYFLVASPWFVAVQWRNPEFFRVFFLQHNLERFASNRFEHPQPLWFFVPVLLLALFPWTGWLGLPLAAAARRLRRLG
ncbi:MAG: ArnT family glycosyltransferase, partial [Terriglobales bacterium]